MQSFDDLINFVMSKQVLGTIIVILVAFLIVLLLNKYISDRLKGKNSYEIKRRKTLIKLFQNIFKYIIFIVAFLIILNFFGVDTKSVIASLGVAGVIIGLALQDTVKDFIGGINLIFENYLAVGDYVNYNGFIGEVIELNLRTTKIKDFEGQVLIISNRNIDSIINISQKRSELYLNIDTAYEAEVLKTEKVLQKVLDQAIKDGLILPTSTYLGINELGSSSVKYLICIHCEPSNRFKVRREMLKRVKIAYEKNNIKIPYNQIEVHHGQDI